MGSHLFPEVCPDDPHATSSWVYWVFPVLNYHDFAFWIGQHPLYANQKVNFQVVTSSFFFLCIYKAKLYTWCVWRKQTYTTLHKNHSKNNNIKNRNMLWFGKNNLKSEVVDSCPGSTTDTCTECAETAGYVTIFSKLPPPSIGMMKLMLPTLRRIILCQELSDIKSYLENLFQ